VSSIEKPAVSDGTAEESGGIGAFEWIGVLSKLMGVELLLEFHYQQVIAAVMQ